MSLPFTIVQGNNLPEISGVARGADSQPQDLTGATVTFKLEPFNGGAAVLDYVAAVGVAPLNAGRAKYAWGANDTANIFGDFKATFRARWDDGREISFPNNSYIKVVIRKR